MVADVTDMSKVSLKSSGGIATNWSISPITCGTEDDMVTGSPPVVTLAMNWFCGTPRYVAMLGPGRTPTTEPGTAFPSRSIT